MADNTGHDMSNYPLFTAACMFGLFLFNKLIGALFEFEPMVKLMTTYGSFVVFVVVTIVQLLRWWKRFQRSRVHRSEN